MRHLKFNETSIHLNQVNKSYNFVSGVVGLGEFNFNMSLGIDVGVELSAVSSVSPAVL